MSGMLLSSVLLGNYAAINTANRSTKFGGVLLGLLLFIAAFFAIQKFLYPIAWPVYGLACLIASAIILRLRWRKMLASPVAFPAGRMAN